jgi:4-hydroxy-tetrahydrodipicolinate synthase
MEPDEIPVRYVIGRIVPKPSAGDLTKREVQDSMFSGLMPAMVTPFDERGEVDLGATEAVIERFIEAGVDGISPLGSTGESSHLTGEERKRFVEEVTRIVSGRVPLVVGVGAAGTREAVELARHAESVGVDAVLIVSPFYWKVGEEALFKHFATVAETVQIPVLVYNLPMLTGIDLSPSLIARIAAECPNVCGLKDTVTEYFHTVAVLREVKRVRPAFSVLSGWEDLILPSLLAGADGSICAFANVAPELFVNLVRSARDGDLERGAELHRRVLSLVTLGAYSDPPISAIKLAMNKLGVPISPAVRGPALPIPEKAYEKVEGVLREVGLLTVREAG